MSHQQSVDIRSQHGFRSSYRVVSEIHKPNHHYWIVYLENSHDLDNLAELKSHFLEVDRFEIKGQSFVVLDVSSPVEQTAEDIAKRLSARELQIATLVALGQGNKQIAHQLHISEWTVSTHLRRIFAKLDVDSRAAMVYRCASLIQLLQSPLETAN